MRNVLVTGGTDGVGRAVALDSLRKGHSVVVVGSTPFKGADFLAQARDIGTGQSDFVQADLRLLSDNARVLDEVRARFDRLDRLVLCAARYRTSRVLTPEGVEENFALSYLSRFVLAHGLRDLFTESALVVNVCGTGTPIGSINWDDLRFDRKPSGFRALMQASRASDLLGVEFARRSNGVPFVLYNPDFVRTNLQRELDQPWRSVAAVLVKVLGKPLDTGVRPLLDLLDTPPAAALTAFRARKPIDMTSRKFARSYDAADARRLHTTTTKLLAELGRADLAPPQGET